MTLKCGGYIGCVLFYGFHFGFIYAVNFTLNMLCHDDYEKNILFNEFISMISSLAIAISILIVHILISGYKTGYSNPRKKIQSTFAALLSSVVENKRLIAITLRETVRLRAVAGGASF